MIKRNAAQCARCGTVIESKHVYDFVTCKCGAIFVDGGHEYLRHGGDKGDFIDLSEFQGNDFRNDERTISGDSITDDSVHKESTGE